MDDEERTARRTLAHEVLRRLESVYGRQYWQPGNSPLEELMQTVLSQHTSDVNSGRAYDELRTRFATWGAVRDAATADVADAIRTGGLADRKAHRIQEILARVLDADADEPLAELGSLPLSEAKSRLASLPGVGPKTAACVLLFALGRPALPVDTHVYRVSHRIGLIDSRIGETRAHDELEALVVPNDVYSFHLTMIAHGRQICHARRPLCPICVVRHLCRYYIFEYKSN